MSRRQRVPRLKEHRRKRNKNPKLSPFQREQQRAKLANQAPTTSIRGSKRDYPISQRAVMEYLMAKQKRQEERWRHRMEAAAALTPATVEGAARSDRALCADGLSVDGATTAASPSPPFSSSSIQEDEKRTASCGREKSGENKAGKHLLKAKNTSVTQPVALNQQLAASLARPIMAFQTSTGNGASNCPQGTIEAIVARKKERKHRRKAEARRERVRQRLEDMERQLKEELLPSKGNKRRNTLDAVDAKDRIFEKKLRQMQKANVEKQSMVKRDAGETDGKKKRKRVSFSEDAVDGLAGDAPQKAMRYPNDKGEKKPREFYELVDVVRYGERVEAPPVFDELPRRDASITRLANRLEQSSRCPSKTNVASSRADRLRLLSSGGGLGENKRLERLGLAPLQGTVAPASGTERSSRQISNEEEMQRLRERVVNAYRSSRRAVVESRKGVDMHHQFPLFS